MGMRPPQDQLLAAASLVASAPGAAAQLAASAGPDTPNGPATWNTTMGYEQLLSIQQHQHELAMQHKDAEVQHVKACLEMLKSNRPADTKHVAAVLQTKDEEASLMMAAKHKELELMAGLLQLREQQIEDFRQLCETQQVELQQLKRLRSGVDAGDANDGMRSPAGTEGTRREAPAVTESPLSQAAKEEHAMLQKEVRRLRLRMEELEAAVGDQNERSKGLAWALEAKSERVKALEEQVRSLHSPVGTWTGSDQESALGGVVEPPMAARPSPPRLQLPPNSGRQRPSPQQEQRMLRPGKLGDDGLPPPRSSSHALSRADSMPSIPVLPPQLGGGDCPQDSQGRRDWRQSSATSLGDGGGSRPLSAVCSQEPHGGRRDWRQSSATSLEGGSRPLSAVCTRPSVANSEEPGDASLPSGQQTFRSAVNVHVEQQPVRVEPRAGDDWGGAAEAAETGRQSQELLHEMRRLRLQMSELERVAGTRGPRRRGKQQQLYPPSQDRLLMSASSFGGESSADGLGGGLGTDPTTDLASVDNHARPERALHSIDDSASSSVAGRSVHSEENNTEVGSGWEYRPHASGDPTDAAVAALVNRPGGRYRGWRALLCRLDRGVYLCGTRRIHLRADTQLERMEASDDGGRSWADLEDLMRGAEASQHALLERARGAAGLSA